MEKSIDDRLSEKICKAEVLITKCKAKNNVPGALKLAKKIYAELIFLKSLQCESATKKEERIRSSNLNHLEGIVLTSETNKDVSGILQSFRFMKNKLGVLLVDIVADNGHTWIKVVARKAVALHQIWAGQGQFGERNIVEQAKEYLDCASENPIHFTPPRVLFSFFNNVTQEVFSILQQMNVSVIGEVIASELSSESLDCSIPVTPTLPMDCHIGSIRCHVTKVNMDITSMIAYISSLTNGNCWFEFEERLLTEQAESEQSYPVLPKLKQFLQEKELVCCETALHDFQTIVNTIGGKNEKQRADEFLKMLAVVPDQPSNRALSLKTGNRIKTRSKIIFGTGDSMKALTVTANSGFVRAAGNQGVSFAVFLHESRALTEQKESTAKRIAEK